MNVENLQRMITKLETIDDSDFNMSYYRDGRNKSNSVYCETVACVVGHCTELDIDNITNNFINTDGVDFLNWSIEFTGLKSAEWTYCFGELWSVIDNTTHGAINRIKRIINKEDFLDIIKFNDYTNYPNDIDFDDDYYEDFLSECVDDGSIDDSVYKDYLKLKEEVVLYS